MTAKAKFTVKVKKVMKARADGKSWVEIQDAGLCTRGEIGAIRKEMRRVKPGSVSNSGPRKSTSSAKPKAKKTTSKKVSGKKVSGKKKKSGKKVEKVSVGRTSRNQINA